MRTRLETELRFVDGLRLIHFSMIKRNMYTVAGELQG